MDVEFPRGPLPRLSSPHAATVDRGVHQELGLMVVSEQYSAALVQPVAWVPQ